MSRKWPGNFWEIPRKLLGDVQALSRICAEHLHRRHVQEMSRKSARNYDFRAFSVSCQGQGKVSSNSVVWGARFSRLKGAIQTFTLFHRFFKFPCHPYYSSRQKGFPGHVKITADMWQKWRSYTRGKAGGPQPIYRFTARTPKLTFNFLGGNFVDCANRLKINTALL